MKLNFRIIGRLGLLLVIFGFFMPISCNMNGFELASLMKNFGNSGSAFFLYCLFLSALAGIIVGLLLLMRKNVPVIADWATLLVCIGSGLLVFFGSLSDGPSLQFGAFVIFIGWIVSFVFLWLNRKTSEEKQSEYIGGILKKIGTEKILKTFESKKCPFCANNIKVEAIVCQYCGKDLPNEKNLENKD